MSLVNCCGRGREARVGGSGVDERVVEHLKRSTIAMVVENPMNAGEWRAYCTGTWVSQDKFLTARHCAAALREDNGVVGSFVRFVGMDGMDIERNEVRGGMVHWGVVMGLGDGDKDLALVMSVDKLDGHDYVEMGRGVRVGERVQLVGHPVGISYTYMVGVVSANRSFDGGHFIQVMVPAFFGNSGGGLFNEVGELVGVVRSIHTRAPEMMFAEETDGVREFLRDHMR